MSVLLTGIDIGRANSIAEDEVDGRDIVIVVVVQVDAINKLASHSLLDNNAPLGTLSKRE